MAIIPAINISRPHTCGDCCSAATATQATSFWKNLKSRNEFTNFHGNHLSLIKSVNQEEKKILKYIPRSLDPSDLRQNELPSQVVPTSLANPELFHYLRRLEQNHWPCMVQAHWGSGENGHYSLTSSPKTKAHYLKERIQFARKRKPVGGYFQKMGGGALAWYTGHLLTSCRDWAEIYYRQLHPGVGVTIAKWPPVVMKLAFLFLLCQLYNVSLKGKVL